MFFRISNNYYINLDRVINFSFTENDEDENYYDCVFKFTDGCIEEISIHINDLVVLQRRIEHGLV